MQTFESNKTSTRVHAKPEQGQSFFAPSIIQPKLTINEPGDKYEREADAMAERVMRMSAAPAVYEAGIHAQPLPLSGIQRKCSDCEQEDKLQRQEKEEEEQVQASPLMRKAGGGYAAAPQLASQLGRSKGGGSPLPGNTLASMNRAFGADFSSVRIHTDSRAAEMSRGIQAKAFTHGSDIYFNRGEYKPESGEGKRLLGHELTHVVQQGEDTQTVKINRQPGGQLPTTPAAPQPGQQPLTQTNIPDWIFYLSHIDWIDGLTVGGLRDQIDQEFAVSKDVAAKNAWLNDSFQYMLLEVQLLQADERLRKQIETKMQRLEKALGPNLQKAQGAKLLKKGESLFSVGSGSDISWETGRLMARLNFMGVMTPLLGSVDKVKNHFKGIREVDFNNKLFLAKDAATRLEQAKATFEFRTSYKFPRSTIGQSLRGRHQTRQSKGMLGHPLGFSIDYYAYENPHLKKSRFFVDEITGQKAILEFFDQKGQPLSYNARRSMILKIGKETTAGGSHSKESHHLLGQVEQAHSAFVEISQAIQDSLLPENKARLQELAVKEYWSKNLPAQKALKTLEKQLNKVRKTAAAAELRHNYQQQKQAYDAQTEALKQELKTLLQPYFDILDQRKTDALAAFSDVDFTQLPTQKALDKIAHDIKKN